MELFSLIFLRLSNVAAYCLDIEHKNDHLLVSTMVWMYFYLTFCTAACRLDFQNYNVHAKLLYSVFEAGLLSIKCFQLVLRMWLAWPLWMRRMCLMDCFSCLGIFAQREDMDTENLSAWLHNCLKCFKITFLWTQWSANTTKQENNIWVWLCRQLNAIFEYFSSKSIYCKASTYVGLQ